ncbi:antibiotic biosynthesis monooxygenase [Xanthomonas sp. NCPPB 2632]|uniref:antibiotic biosynthesis monooxygenase family protein n=1 Tax=Xanthomonas sp. NCPPB 2632 TaxID=3240912 RepID=UPI003515C615
MITEPNARVENNPEVSTARNEVGFAVVYRWRLHPHAEEAFVSAWARVSSLLESERGSCGARLHRGDDGLWYSYAQWPTSEARDAAFSLGDVDPAAQAAMKAAVLEYLPEIRLVLVADLLHRRGRYSLS